MIKSLITGKNKIKYCKSLNDIDSFIRSLSFKSNLRPSNECFTLIKAANKGHYEPRSYPAALRHPGPCCWTWSWNFETKKKYFLFVTPFRKNFETLTDGSISITSSFFGLTLFENASIAFESTVEPIRPKPERFVCKAKSGRPNNRKP